MIRRLQEFCEYDKRFAEHMRDNPLILDDLQGAVDQLTQISEAYCDDYERENAAGA